MILFYNRGIKRAVKDKRRQIMEKKTISAGIIGVGGFIGQEHLKHRITDLGKGSGRKL